MKISFPWRRLTNYLSASLVCSATAVCATLASSSVARADFIPNAITGVVATAGANSDGAGFEQDVVNGVGLTVGNPLDSSTWTHDNQWTSGWQMNYSNGSPADTAWFTLNLGSVHNDLNQAVIWNVREVLDRGTQNVNVYYGTNPTTGISDGQSVPSFLPGDGWTLLSNNSIAEATGGGTPADGAINLAGINAQYISFQILSNWGSNIRVGFSEIQVTTVPEPSTIVLCGLGLAGVAAVGWRRRKA